jgi:hypothetical protein
MTMEDRTTDQIADRIKKLLALAERSDSEHEAALAAGRAAALMERHAITRDMLEGLDLAREEEPQAWEDPLFSGKQLATWRRRLASVLAKSSGCSIYTSGRRIMLIGGASEVARVRYLFAACARSVEALARKKAGNGATWLNNYRVGCVEAIGLAIEAERARERGEMRAEATGSALVRLDQALVRVDARAAKATAWGFRHLGLRRVSRTTGRVDAGAREQGRRDGAGIYPGRRPGIGGGTRQISG